MKPPISPERLAKILEDHGTKASKVQIQTVLAAANGSMDALEAMLKLPIRRLLESPPTPDSADRADVVKRGGADANTTSRGKTIAPHDPKRRTMMLPTGWTLTLQWSIVLFFAWPLVRLAYDIADMAFTAAAAILAVFQ